MAAFNTLIRSAALTAVVALTACYDSVPSASISDPPDYSPNHVPIKLVSDSGREKTKLVPEACLMPDDQSAADYGPARLPPGCANNYNLQRIVERKRDLTNGRPLGPAPAAPASRAAQRYIDGEPIPSLAGGVRSGDGPDGGGQTTVEPR
ncbi:MAG: hypothetical protein HC850_12920 [Rhodomicrobium sp.]|nr:hypothetical protein [Rhodomicrobium sp.]